MRFSQPRPSPHTLIACTMLVVEIAAQAGCGDVSAVDAVVRDAVQQLALPGASLRIEESGRVLFEQTYGSYGIERVVPIASASKWLSAAVLMSCVDSGHLRLDDTVSSWLPAFDRPDKRGITLRQCFLHTSGLPADSSIVGDDTLTLQQAAARIALLPLAYTPGSAFLYGGVSMHVAGAVCEVATGLAWDQLLRARLTGPLGMDSTDFGTTGNPRIAGGARSSLRDYARFVAMLRDGGVSGGHRVLGTASLREMFTEQTSHLPILGTPHPNNAPYGIGTWIERRDAQGRATLVVGAGAFGFTGWVDLERGAGGTFLVLDRFPPLYPFVVGMFDSVRQAMPPLGSTCVGVDSPACGRAIVLNGDRLPRSGALDFALTVAGAPSATAGAVALATDALTAGVPVLGVSVHVPLAPPPLLVAVSTGADGTLRLPLPVIAEVGQALGVQAFFVGTAGCGGPGALSASQALRLLVQAP